MKLAVRFFFFFFALCPVVVTSAIAQSSYTSVRGTITDSSGAAISQASVDLLNSAADVHETTTSDQRGNFQFTQLTPGTYVLTVSASGFGVEIKRMELLVDQPSTANFSLKVKSDTTEVQVVADTLSLNTTDATIGNAVNNVTVQSLPMEGRNVQDLLSLQPGVLYLGHALSTNTTDENEDSRSGATAGARSDQGDETIDGVDNNPELTGYSFTGVLRSTLDSVEEFRVTTTAANAEAGRSSGGQISVVTKSGTNHINGSLYEYNRNTIFAANDWFNKSSELQSGLPNKTGELIRNTYGAAVGGPIVKDKLFFFANYEGQRTAENQEVTQVVPTALFRAGTIQYTNTSGTTTSLTPAQFASMDPKCFSAGYCPWGPGVDPNSTALMKTYPLPNSTAVGDGLNTAGYTFSAPDPASLSTYLVRIDYVLSDKHRLFAHANLQGDSQLSTPQFPGQPPSGRNLDNSRGIIGGDTWVISNNVVNSARFGFIREGYASEGAGSGSYVNISSPANPVAETRSSLVNIPVYNMVDDFTWLKHEHSFQFGGNWRIIQANRGTNLNSFYTATTSGEYDSALAGTGQSLDPDAFGFPTVAQSFVTSYSTAAMTLAGPIDSYSLQYNYQANNSTKTGTLLPVGATVESGYKSNEVEYYLQDSWRVSHKVTITYGIRHSILQTPYEVHGQQVQPTVDVEQWFTTRLQQGSLGNTVQPPFSFSPSGKANGGKPFWPTAWGNIAPRLAIAYAIDSKTAVHAGFGMYYDNFGQGIVGSYSQLGAFGLSGKNATAANFGGPDNSTRFMGLNTFPAIPSGVVIPPTNITYPFTPPIYGEAGATALDDHVHTPYSYAFNLSVQRGLPKGFMVETAYVGRIGIHLLQQRDLGTALDLVDPKSGMDYYTAAAMLDQAIYSGVPTSAQAPIAYWQDLFPDAAGLDAAGTGTPGYTATQNIMNAYRANPKDSTIIINSMDTKCNPGCGGQEGRYFDQQFTSLFAWSSIGTSSYNAGQITVQHPMTNGLQMDFNYTLSKSIDIGSDTERTCINCSTLNSTASGYIVNVYKPRLNRAVSDFDTRHTISTNTLYLLPFGKGQRFANGGGNLTNALIGGWQLSGIGRWTSGLPFSIKLGPGQVTDWHEVSDVVQTGRVPMKRTESKGTVNAFANPTLLNTELTDSFQYGGGVPIRYPLPGEAGTRNGVRGDGFFGIDTGLAKTWKIAESQSVKFDWEVFNTTNSPRFDDNGADGGIANSIQANGATFGNYSHMLNTPRVQQFSLRYAF